VLFASYKFTGRDLPDLPHATPAGKGPRDCTGGRGSSRLRQYAGVVEEDGHLRNGTATLAISKALVEAADLINGGLTALYRTSGGTCAAHHVPMRATWASST
jgi:hypothetical protein